MLDAISGKENTIDLRPPIERQHPLSRGFRYGEMARQVQNQISFFDGDKPLKITKPIRLIELFAGIGAQAKALEKLCVPFEHYRICEFDKYAIKSYNAVHGTKFETSDITMIHAEDVCV